MLMLNNTEVLVTLFYLLFVICVVYPPAEFVSAGFTIPQIFENFLGSENVNFVSYHMKRITLTMLIHSALPLGYILCLWCGGSTNAWLPAAGYFNGLFPLLMGYLMLTWWEGDRSKHPVVKALIPYVTEGIDWRVIASNLNVEFRSVDKVSIQLTATSKFVATETWLIKMSQYSMNAVKQLDCTLVATGMDSHNLTISGEEEIQFVNIQAVPSRRDVPEFGLRLSGAGLRELQPRLRRPVRVPEHLQLQPTLIERFVLVFRQHVDGNPVYYIDDEPELCIGCMQAPADVKLNKRCEPVEAEGHPPCQQCNCRVLWCCACIARWWAARSAGAAAGWLAGRGSCPVCRAPFCLLDVCPARTRA